MNQQIQWKWNELYASISSKCITERESHSHSALRDMEEESKQYPKGNLYHPVWNWKRGQEEQNKTNNETNTNSQAQSIRKVGHYEDGKEKEKAYAWYSKKIKYWRKGGTP